MPLKHDTETGLILFLGCAIAFTGVVCAFLPPLSLHVYPWAIAFVVSIAYPLLLYPMLRLHRADYPFRLLHFAPAGMLLLWLFSELLASAIPMMQRVQTWYTFGWSAAAVVLFFLLLILFCARVIRQRFLRIGLLLIVLLPFLLIGTFSERGQWDRRLIASVWQGAEIGNVQPSEDRIEEQWRVELRRMEQRRLALLARQTGSIIADVTAPLLGTQITAEGFAAQTGTGEVIPPRLPSSGFGMEGVTIAMLAMTSAAIHRRTMARGRARRV